MYSIVCERMVHSRIIVQISICRTSQHVFFSFNTLSFSFSSSLPPFLNTLN